MKKGNIAFTGGKIYTIDSDNRIVQSIVIKDGRIVYVGNDQDAKDHFEKDMEVVELEGKTVLPGLIEPHVHVPGNAYNVLFNINLFDAKDEAETMDMIEAFINAHPEKSSYYGRGFMSQVFPGLESSLGPKKERLDKICPDKPVVIADYGGHVTWLNSEAFRQFGITEETPDVEGGVIEKDPQTGELWGTLKEEAKCLYPDQQLTLAEKEEALEWFQKQMHAYGYTSAFALRPSPCSDPRPIFDAMESLEKKEKLTLRLVCGREIKANLPKEEQVREAIQFAQKYKSNFLMAKTAKFFIDGAVEGVSAYLSEPYLPAAGKGSSYQGESLWETDELAEVFTQVLEAGLNIHIHAIGDQAVTVAVDALEMAQNTIPGDHRNTITHLQLVKKEDIKRMAELNIIACCNVYWHLKDPCIYFEGELPFLGKERAEKEYPLGSFVRNGVTITSSGDVPITPYPNPFFAIQAGVTRNLYNASYFKVDPIKDMDDPSWLLGKEERVSVLDMVKAYTINCAYASFVDHKTGSLEVGKLGDLIVLDQDIFKAAPLDIEKTKILRTVVGGTTVFTG